MGRRGAKRPSSQRCRERIIRGSDLYLSRYGGSHGKKEQRRFPEKTKLQIAKRAAGFRRRVAPPPSGDESEINLGTAAHICAAAPGGPRYDPNMTREERRSARNGIWMCRLHGTAVDLHDPSSRLSA